MQFRLAAAAAFALLLSPHGFGGAKQAPPALVIEMTDANTYSPSEATIKAGQTVEWVNKATGPHTVTANPEKAAWKEDVVLPKPDAAFDSGTVPAGKTFRHTFTIPGKYKYFCKVHERGRMMIGQLTVTQ